MRNINFKQRMVKRQTINDNFLLKKNRKNETLKKIMRHK